jgi:hypothetical protein
VIVLIILTRDVDLSSVTLNELLRNEQSTSGPRLLAKLSQTGRCLHQALAYDQLDDTHLGEDWTISGSRPAGKRAHTKLGSPYRRQQVFRVNRLQKQLEIMPRFLGGLQEVSRRGLS